MRWIRDVAEISAVLSPSMGISEEIEDATDYHWKNEDLKIEAKIYKFA